MSNENEINIIENIENSVWGLFDLIINTAITFLITESKWCIINDYNTY